MDDTIRNRLQASFIDDAAARFYLRRDSVEALKGFESFIYAGLRDGQKVILRLAHSLRRTADLIRGELDFMAHLSRGGAAVCAPLPSVSGALVEAVDDGAGGQFLASCFTWAEGAPPDGEHTEPFLRAYGRTVGQMHRLVQSYTPGQAAWRRPSWDDPRMLDVKGWLGGEQSDIVDTYITLRKQTEFLAKDPAGFNLIHQDMHMGNFHVTADQKIAVFDFDDCAYGHFINDLAIVLFHAMKRVSDPVAFARAFFGPFLRGYREQNALDPGWLAHVPLFLALRRVDLYAVVHRSMKDALRNDPARRRWAEVRRRAILDGVPVVDMDFAVFEPCLRASGA